MRNIYLEDRQTAILESFGALEDMDLPVRADGDREEHLARMCYLIAATAELRGQQLATLNVRHFPMFAGLRPP